MGFSDDAKAKPSFVASAHMRRSRLPERPWEKHDPRERPTKGFTLRLNEYQLELLRAVAYAEYPRTSQQAVAIRHLVAALEKAAAEL